MKLILLFIISIASMTIQASDTPDTVTAACPEVNEYEVEKSDCGVRFYTESFHEQCESLSEYYIQDDFSVECFHNYHHYNSDAYKRAYRTRNFRRKDQVRLGGFNMLHPVNGKTRFKNLELVAEIIDKEFDVVAGIELIPVPKDEFRHNNKIDGFIREQRAKILSGELSTEERSEAEENIEKAIGSYLAPGYLRILEELIKKDDSWSLIISPRAESAKPADQKEFTGFFYRAQYVKPKSNNYCAREDVEIANNDNFGCIPWFDEARNRAFSRRPFVSSFESNGFEFTMVASHIVFTSPKDANLRADILFPAFGFTELGPLTQGPMRGAGMTSANYARWSEVKLTLDLMKEMKESHGVKNLIYVADFNLEKFNETTGEEYRFWNSHVLPAYPGAQVYVTEKTSIDKNNGYSSNYDHFIFNPEEVTECVQRDGSVQAGRIDFFTTDYITNFVNDVYRPSNFEYVMDLFLSRFEDHYQAGGRVGNLKLSPFDTDESKIRDRLEDQLLGGDSTEANTMIKVISDHVPVYLNCNI